MVPGHRNTKRRVKAAAAIKEVILTRGGTGNSTLLPLSDLSIVPGHRTTKSRVKAAAAIREVIFAARNFLITANDFCVKMRKS
jgi:hypothetical protein